MADRAARIRQAGEGGVLAIAIWCTLSAMHLLPGVLRVVPGLLGMVAAGVAIGGCGGRRVVFAVLATTSVIAAVVACSALADTILSRWERSDVLPATGVGAVVVLSAGLNADTTISGESLDHLIAGLELVRAGRAPVLVTTTTSGRFPAGVLSSVVDQARIIGLLGGGIEWIRVPGGRSTRDEAVGARAVLRPRGVDRVAVITSPMHTRRACAAFEAVGFVVTCMPARLRTAGNRPLAEVPGARLEAFGAWVYEVAAMAKYRMMGWLPASRAGTVGGLLRHRAPEGARMWRRGYTATVPASSCSTATVAGASRYRVTAPAPWMARRLRAGLCHAPPSRRDLTRSPEEPCPPSPCRRPPPPITSRSHPRAEATIRARSATTSRGR